MTTYELPAEEKISADWGERCPDFDPGCFCCQMWAMYDEVGRLKRENEHFTCSGIVEVAVRNQSVSEYMNHWEGRAIAAEQKLADLQSALAPQAVLSAGHQGDRPMTKVHTQADIANALIDSGINEKISVMEAESFLSAVAPNAEEPYGFAWESISLIQSQNEQMRLVIEEVWKNGLVIESAVRRGDGPDQYRGVVKALQMVKEARAAIAIAQEATP
jgi:hypothetical protein